MQMVVNICKRSLKLLNHWKYQTSTCKILGNTQESTGKFHGKYHKSTGKESEKYLKELGNYW